MPSKLKEISEFINRQQKQSILDLTSGHLNENHLYKPNSFANKRTKSIWSSSEKFCPTVRPFHRLETHSNRVEQMKESLVQFTYTTLPDLTRKRSVHSSKSNEFHSKSSQNDEILPPIQKDSSGIPSFTIALSEEQRLNKMKIFNENVLQKSDVFLHGLGFSQEFVYFVEQNLELKLKRLENQRKTQSISLNRLQLYSEAMNQLIEGSSAFGPVLNRIKNEYEFYLDHLLDSQPEYGTHIAEQLKRLRQAQPNFSAADAELFDIDRIEEETRKALENNKFLNEQLKLIREEQIQRESMKSIVPLKVSTTPTDLIIKSQSEQIDEIRENIFDLIDRMNTKKEELTDKFVATSICSQLQQAVRDTEMDIIKTRKQNETLNEEIDLVEKRIKEKILSHDQSEFAQENVDQIMDLMKKIDLLHIKRSNTNKEKEKDDKDIFLHTYDDYFS